MDLTKKIQESQRIVFKFGTNALTRDDGRISLSRLYSFIESIADLKKQGKEILIISSGAVELGVNKLNIERDADFYLYKQACAAIGQNILMYLYEEGFDKYAIATGQVLLTEDDFSTRSKYLSLRNTLTTLLEMDVIPIINENDTVKPNNIKYIQTDNVQACFSDNDKLSALVASKLKADLLVIVSDIDGLYDDDPRKNKNAKVIPIIEEFNKKIESLGFESSEGGTGGMKTKLEAAKIVVHSGGYTAIINGTTPNIINKLFTEKNIGTIFKPIANLSSKKLWIAYANTVFGKIKVNNGAKYALIKDNASLLSAGIIEVQGDFDINDVVSVVDNEDKEIARGITNYNSDECEKIAGKHSFEIKKTLGYKNQDEVIYRDNIVVL